MAAKVCVLSEAYESFVCFEHNVLFELNSLKEHSLPLIILNYVFFLHLLIVTCNFITIHLYNSDNLTYIYLNISLNILINFGHLKVILFNI